MTTEISRLSAMARRAVETYDWPTVARCAQEIQRRDPSGAEGFFLQGLAERAQKRARLALLAFEKALSLDPERYDAAVELAAQYSLARRNGEAARLLAEYSGKLVNSPRYLDLAGTVYTQIGMSKEAWPLFTRANELQPGVDLFQANLATCAVFLGKIDQAREIYEGLLERYPDHRRNHYQLSRLQKARDYRHIDRMKEILGREEEQPGLNIPLYYAIGKELEDLEQWDEAFDYYRQGGDAVCRRSGYDVSADLALIDSIIETCGADWLGAAAQPVTTDSPGRTPIFIVGLPRTGTTLTERILSSHSKVGSLGETMFFQRMLRLQSGVQTTDAMNPEIIAAAARREASNLARGYMEALDYRLGEEPMFIEKLPLNFLFLGFIARAWPDARIVHLVRHPMDSCFSMYKAVFTWAYNFTYSLDDLGRYYIAHDRLREHWRSVLPDRLVEVEYESLVADPEFQTRRLLDRMGLEFEPACLDFDRNRAPSATASSVQVRQKVHTGSVDRWKRYARQLEPLRKRFETAGIEV